MEASLGQVEMFIETFMQNAGDKKYLTEEEFGQLNAEEMFPGLSTHEAFEKLDKNHDGGINFNEMGKFFCEMLAK